MFQLDINRDLFLREEIPGHHPLSIGYKDWWREERKRCVEGYWVSGRWMPGTLYFYANYAIIRLNKDHHSKVKSFGHPWLRDLEWEFFYNWTEARGFSGFDEDDYYTCHRIAEKPEEYNEDTLRETHPNLFTPEGKLKRYIPAREYLRMTHREALGRPLFENEAKNMMMMGSRGFGKSYSVAALIAHEWLMDGMTHYTKDNIQNPTSTEIVVGAGDAKFSSDLLSKVVTMIERLPGEIEIGDKYYPSPLAQQGKGSWMPSKRYIATYDKKVGGSWVTRGSQSSIKHVTYKDNPFAANGTRPAIMAFEEIGMFANLIPSHIAGVECMRDGGRKFGSGLYLGTGGDMEGGGTLDASRMFYDPKSYDLLEFDDVWENRGKIGYFVPAYMGLNEYKDKIYGNTDAKAAISFLEGKRAELRDTKSGSSALDGELQNRPLVPSEAFLTKSGNIFPVAELRERLTTLEASDRWTFLETVVHLYFDAESPTGVNYSVDTKNELQPINQFPWTEKNREGAVCLYELPVTDEHGRVPDGLYVIGHDPYASDDPDGESNASIYVLKTKKYLGRYGHDEVVAEYVGRPYAGRKIVNEILLKLSLMYGNAKVYFENVRGNVKEYFEKNKKLHLLAKQPQTVMSKKAAHTGSRGTVPYGYPMSGKHMKIEGLHYIRDWLMEERNDVESDKPIRNLDRIYSKGLLQELIAFNLDGNFDRVMGFMGCVIGLEETYNQYEKEVRDESARNAGKGLSFITNNTSLFRDSNTPMQRKLVDRQKEKLPQYAFEFEALKNK